MVFQSTKMPPENLLSMVTSFNALLDSGCTHHVVRDQALFHDYVEESISVGTANCGSHDVLGWGDVEFRSPKRSLHLPLHIFLLSKLLFHLISSAIARCLQHMFFTLAPSDSIWCWDCHWGHWWCTWWVASQFCSISETLGMFHPRPTWSSIRSSLQVSQRSNITYQSRGTQLEACWIWCCWCVVYSS